MPKTVIVLLINQSHKSIDLTSYVEVRVYSRRDWCGGMSVSLSARPPGCVSEINRHLMHLNCYLVREVYTINCREIFMHMALKSINDVIRNIMVKQQNISTQSHKQCRGNVTSEYCEKPFL
jgi:hypothetical protein